MGSSFATEGIKEPRRTNFFHSAYAGFTGAYDEVYTAQGLRKAGLRETAEECLLITRDKTPWLIVPNDSREFILESAKRLELELKPHFADVGLMDSTDRIEVYDEDENMLFSYNCFSHFKWESETSVESVQIRKLPFLAEEILPIDAEGMIDKNTGKYKRYNRESYILSPDEIRGKRFGDVLENPEVYQAEIVGGTPRIYKPEYNTPYYGPDMVPVIHPHVWAPEDQLSRHLDALGLGENWIDVELWKERTKLEGKSLLPENVKVPKPI